MLMLHAFYVAACAVVFAVVLVDSGMLLEPVQRWLCDKWFGWQMARAHDGRNASGPIPVNLDDQWWWKPLWGCYRCVAGQWALWGYLIRCVVLGVPYSPWQHLTFLSLTILFACLLNKAYQWTQN